MNIKQYIKLFLPVLLLTGACEPKVNNRGYVSTISWEDGVIIGSTTRDEVLSYFGSPSSQSTFGQETWYYISSRKEAVAFLAPEIAKQDVVRITFNTEGVVDGLELYDKENSKNIDIAKRVTPTEGHELSFVEQILGNIGRFNQPGGGGRSGAATGRAPGGGL